MTQLSHSARSIMNSVLPRPSCSSSSLTKESEGEWDKTKGNGHINYKYRLGGSYYQRVTAERCRDVETEEDTEMEMIMLTECPVRLQREGVCPSQ